MCSSDRGGGDAWGAGPFLRRAAEEEGGGGRLGAVVVATVAELGRGLAAAGLGLVVPVTGCEMEWEAHQTHRQQKKEEGKTRNEK